MILRFLSFFFLLVCGFAPFRGFVKKKITLIDPLNWELVNFLLLLAKFEKTIHIVFLYPVCVLLVLIINRHIGESDSRGLIWVSTATGTLQFEYFLFTTTYSLVMG